jgi:hypothetical protein
MANDLRRRVKMLEGRVRNIAPALTADEIAHAVTRYEADRGEEYPETPPSSAFGQMLHAMSPSVARIFLHAHPVDLMV